MDVLGRRASSIPQPGSRDGSDERGAVAIIVAVFVVVAVLLLALVVDRGRAYVVRAQLQNSVDAAALAGGYELCPFGNPTSAATTYAQLNGLQVGYFLVDAPQGGGYVNVRAGEVLPTFFAPFAGTNELSVAAQATAADNCTSSYALYAGTVSYENSGGNLIKGSVYSADSIKITGQTSVWGTVDVVGGGCTSSCNIKDENGAPLAVSNLPSPAVSPTCYAYRIGLDRPGTTSCSPVLAGTGVVQGLPTAAPGRVDGTGLNVAKCTVGATWQTANPGGTFLDCGTNDVVITASFDGTGLNAIRTSGSITIDAAVTLGSSTRPVLLYTTSAKSTKQDPAINVKGSASLNLFGYAYAPNGLVYSGGQGNIQWTGVLIANGIDMNGTGSDGGSPAFLALEPNPVLIQ